MMYIWKYIIESVMNKILTTSVISTARIYSEAIEMSL